MYILIALTLCIATFFSLTQSADRSPTSLVFNALIFSFFIGLFFLLIDYALTVLNKYHLMKYFYLLALLATVPRFVPTPEALSTIVGILLVVATVLLAVFSLTIIVLFFIKASHEAKAGEGVEKSEHAIHIFTQAYQKQKESKEPLEAQIYDYFAGKIQGFLNSRSSGKAQ